MDHPKTGEVYEYLEDALTVVHRYVCSRCFGRLSVSRSNPYTVKCDNENCDGEGFVARQYAEWARNKSHFEFKDAQYNLLEFFHTESTGKTPEQILKELGF